MEVGGRAGSTLRRWGEVPLWDDDWIVSGVEEEVEVEIGASVEGLILRGKLSVIAGLLALSGTPEL